jgi:hypothetical protein
MDRIGLDKGKHGATRPRVFRIAARACATRRTQR